MMNRLCRLARLLLATAALLLAAPTLATPATPSALQEPWLLQLAQAQQPRADNAAHAARIAKRRYGGKILKVETHRTERGVIYRVKLLQPNGRVRTVTIPGRD